LSEAFKSEIPKEISLISPIETSIIDGNKFINEKISLPNDGIISNIRSLDKREVIHPSATETVTAACVNCTNSTTTSEIKINLEGSSQTFWFVADILYKANILVATQNIDVMTQSLNSELFTKVSRNVQHPDQYFSNLEQLKFYKLSGTLTAGAPLETRKLVPILLVTPGIASKVIINNENLKLSSSAIPLRSGKLNEMIPLRQTKSQRTIYGRVTGANEVTVEL